MIAFYLPGGIPIYAYSLLLAAGTFIGLAGVALKARENDAQPLVEAGVLILLAGLVGSRLVYAWQSWPVFQEHPLQALQVQLGGLSWPGAMAGALLALPVIARLQRRPPGVLADDLLPLLAAVCVTAWLGCIVDGSGYGPQGVWPGLVVPDEWGVLAERWPVQLAAAAACLGLYWLTDQAPRRAAAIPGLRACLMLLGLAVVQLSAAWLTIPDRLWFGLSQDAWAAVLLGCLGLAGLLLATRYGKQRGNE